MTRIEEITALLIEEIETFKKDVNRLEKVASEVKNTKISIDTTNLIKLHKEQLNMQTLSFKEQERNLKNIEDKIQHALIVPKWLTFFIIVLIGCFLGSFYLNIHQSKQKKVIEKMAFDRGVEAYKTVVVDFFKENPKAHKMYKKWSEKK